MFPVVSKITDLKQNISTAFLVTNVNQLPQNTFSDEEIKYVSAKLEKDDDCTLYRYPMFFWICKIKPETDKYPETEALRKSGAKFSELLKKEKTLSAQIANFSETSFTLPFTEGLLLALYAFDKYKKEKENYSLTGIFVSDHSVSEMEINELLNLSEAVYCARDLVNEPVSYLNATQMAEEFEKMGESAGFSVEVLHREKIESLKMGGLLAVNKGSIDPPTFSIMEWKPENAVNDKPVVLVGKGVVFDTGGLSLKPTPKSMDYMKCDMAGGAVVASTLFALAKNKIPVHVIGLVPATDNRPDGNALAPGDIISMFDGTTVEIKNTDAEGRLILADALSYAKKYNPALVIDLATLTGAAEIVAGSHAAVAMGNTPEYLSQLKETGLQTYERLIEVPLWKEYAEPLKSQVADLNNLGTREAQSTIAGKFLEHFTGYPWIHLDIAGPAFLHEKESYKPAGGTGFGTRLLYNFLKKVN